MCAKCIGLYTQLHNYYIYIFRFSDISLQNRVVDRGTDVSPGATTQHRQFWLMVTKYPGEITGTTQLSYPKLTEARIKEGIKSTRGIPLNMHASPARPSPRTSWRYIQSFSLNCIPHTKHMDKLYL